MSQSLGTIYVSLEANTAKFVEGLSRASAIAQASARNISKEFSGLQRVASQTFGAFGSLNPAISQVTFAISSAGRAAADAMKSFGSMGGAVGAIASITAGSTAAMASVAAGTIALVMHTAESTAKLYEQSQAAGVSVEALSGLSYVAKQAGVDQEIMVTGLERMARSADAAARAPAGASNAFTRLGIAVKDSAGQMLPTQAIFEALASRFAAMPDGVQKTALAIQIFGRGGAALIPVLNEGGDAIDRMLAKARALGVVISGETARSAHEFEDSLQELTSAAGGAMVTLMSDLLPALQSIGSALVKTTENGRTGIENITHWTAEFVKGSLGVINTFLHGFEQIGIVIEAVGHAVSGTVQAMLASFKVQAQLASFNFSGAQASAKEGLHDLTSVFTDFWSETKQNWKENSDFINSLTFHPDYTINGGIKAGIAALGSARYGTGAPVDEGDDTAQKKLASALAEVIAKLKEEAATAGLSAGQVEDYRLKVLGATAAEIAHVDSLHQIANAAEIAAGKLGNVKMQPAATSVAALETLRDKYSGLSAEGAKWIQVLEQQGLALDALVNAAAPFTGMNVDLSTIGAAVGAQDQPRSFTDVALQQAQEAGYRIESRAGKSFGFSENVPQLQDMQTALASVGESTVLVDAAIGSAMDRMITKIDEAAMKMGTLTERFKGLLGTIAEQGQDPLGKFFDTMSKGIDDISGQLAHLIVTGQSGFKKMFEGLGESALKTTFQSSFGMLAQLALGFSARAGINDSGMPFGIDALADNPLPLTSGRASAFSGIGKQGAAGYESLGKTIAGSFGIKLPGAEGGKPTGTQTNPIYVAFANVSGGMDPLVAGITKGLPSPKSGIDSILGLIPKPGEEPAGSSTTPFGDFGGSLALGPAPPEGAGSSVSSIGGGISSMIGAGKSISSILGLIPKPGAQPASSSIPFGLDALNDNALPLTSSSGSASLFGQVGGGISSMINAGESIAKVFPKILSFFGGFLAGGGDVTPGKAYVVGEKHPEFFVPKTAGTVAPTLKMGSGGGGVVNNFQMHIHGVQDADSFRRSQTQIYAQISAQLAMANSRA